MNLFVVYNIVLYLWSYTNTHDEYVSATVEQKYRELTLLWKVAVTQKFTDGIGIYYTNRDVREISRWKYEHEP